MALADNLEAYWKMDEASGSRADSVNSSTMSDNNTVTSNTGKINSASEYTSANSEYLSATSNSHLVFGDEPLTINLWVYLTALGTVGIFCKWATGAVADCEYAVRLVSSAMDFRVGDGSLNHNVASADVIAGSTWYMLTAQHDPTANTIGIAVNAGTMTTAAHSTGILQGTGDAVAGRTGGFNGQYVDGRIDEVGVWRRVLSSAEITSLYNGGNGLSYDSINPPTVALHRGLHLFGSPKLVIPNFLLRP